MASPAGPSQFSAATLCSAATVSSLASACALTTVVANLATNGMGIDAWDVEVSNHLGELVASCDILTLVAKRL